MADLSNLEVRLNMVANDKYLLILNYNKMHAFIVMALVACFAVVAEEIKRKF